MICLLYYSNVGEIAMNYNDIKLPSNTRFGTFFSVVFLSLFFYFLIYSNIFLAFTFLLLCFLAAFITLIKPILLTPFNKFWMTLGFFLGKIISPIVLGAIFYLLITPIGVLTRIFRRDELMINSYKRQSFWRIREHKTFSPNSFKNQY